MSRTRPLAAKPIQNLVSVRITRSHWVATVVGKLDAVWDLTEAEQLDAMRLVGQMLDQLNIPDRGEPAEVDLALVTEAMGRFYTDQLSVIEGCGADAAARVVSDRDQVVPIDVWRTNLVEMFVNAYPDLDGFERLFLEKYFNDLLVGFGAENRAPRFIGEDVARTAAARGL